MSNAKNPSINVLKRASGAERIGYGSETVKQGIDTAKQGATDASAEAASATLLTQQTIKKPDLLEKVRACGQITGMYFRSFAGGMAAGFNMSKDLDMAVEYRFRYDGDNLLLLSGVFVGQQDAGRTAVRAENLTGTFNTTSAPNSYTTTPGDSFELNFTGAYLRVNTLAESRGGLWHFICKNQSGTVVARNDVTCYRQGSGLRNVVVFDQLPFDTYTVTAIFKGDDPDFPPSSSPSRGYIYYDPADAEVKTANYSRTNIIAEGSQVDLITQNTVSDFAIKARPEGSAYGTEWVPEHGSVNGVATTVLCKMLVDGETVNDVAGAAANIDFKEIEQFTVSQQFAATNPNGADGSMWAHRIEHVLEKNGVLTVTQKATFQQNTVVDAGYWLMFGVESSPANLDRIVFSNGETQKPVPVDGSSYTWGRDNTSIAALGEYAAGNYYGAAIDCGALSEAISFGTSYEPATPGLMQYRATGIAKGYWQFLDSVTVPAGAVFTSQSKMCVVAGVRSPNVQLESVG